MASVLVESMVGKWRILPAKGVPARSRLSVSSSKASAIGGAGGVGSKDMGSTLGQDAHAEIDGRGGVSERPGGDEVDASFGIFADRIQLNASGGLDRHLQATRVDELDGGGHLGR